jgi:hypothetical protein
VLSLRRVLNFILVRTNLNFTVKAIFPLCYFSFIFKDVVDGKSVKFCIEILLGKENAFVLLILVSAQLSKRCHVEKQGLPFL